MGVTIHDLARLAGVNASTVSRALRGDERVKPETRNRIAELARREGYKLNLPARQLAAGKTGNIWLFLGSPDSDIERLTAIRLDERFYEERCDLQLLLHHNSVERFQRRLEKLYQRAADGAILIPPGDTMQCEALTRQINALPIPHLFIDRYWPGVHAPIITTDNTTATRTLAEHCWEWGAREFLLDFHHNNLISVIREQAARDFLESVGGIIHATPETVPSNTTTPLGIIGNCGKGIPQLLAPEQLAGRSAIYGGFFDYWENQSLEFYRHVIICRQNFIAIADCAVERLNRMLRGDLPQTPGEITLIQPESFLTL